MTTTESTAQTTDTANAQETTSETRPTQEAAPQIRRAKPLALMLVTLALGACSAPGSGSATGGATGPASTSVEETLSRLGVPLDTGPRVGNDGQAVAADFDPLGPGSQSVIEKKDELFALGMQLGTSDGAGFYSLSGSGAPSWFADVTSPTSPPWALAKAGYVRAAAAADIDGDGRQETIVVSAHPDVTNPGSTTEIDLSIVDDIEAPFPLSLKTTAITSLPGVGGLTVVAGDFDGDNKIDLAVGVVSSVSLPGPTGTPVTCGGAELLFLRNNGDGTFALDQAHSKTLVTPSATGPTQTALVLAPAELDGDRPSELALVLNDTFSGYGNSTYSAHYYVFDDALTGYAALGDGAAGTAATPIAAADLAAGDVDGDGLDELVLGGPEAITEGCSPTIVALALDDAAHHFAPIGTPHPFTVHWGDCGGENDAPTIAWAPVRLLQLDTDAAKEILVGDTFFADLAGAADLPNYPNIDPFTKIGNLPTNAYINASNTANNKFNPNTAAVAIAAVQQSTAPLVAADAVLVYTQDSSAIVSYTPSCATPPCTVTQGTPLAVTFAGSSVNGPLYPILVPVDVTGETIVLRRADASHQLVFTQPLVIAALAAPPCENGIGQNTDACVTTYGAATSQGTGQEQDSSSSVGVMAGIHVDGSLVGDVEATASLTATVTNSTDKSYTLTQQITYSSGSMEDSVVFATVPYDQYHYTVMSGSNIGQSVTVSVPRAPVVMIAERGFYNSTVAAGSLLIDDRVFRHTIGDITTYPSLADETALAGQTAVLAGMHPGAVGQGGGSTTISDAVERDSTVSNTVQFQSDFDVQATAGVVMAGFSVGTSTSDTLSVTMGLNTSFSGTVGSIDADHLSDNFYQFNMFAYTQQDATTDQKFQVVNYWVQQ